MTPAVKGILGTKVGMTQLFDDQGRVVPVTVIRAGPCRVAQVKTFATDGYEAVQLAFDEVGSRRLTQPELGHLKKAGLSSFRHLAELRVREAGGFAVGQEIRADIFAQGEKADVIGVSKGKGFAGVVKRHGFAGLPGSHGTERKHRSPGSVGASATPSRIVKGMRMAGHLGARRVTALNLEVVSADPERNLLLLRGAVPGPAGGLVVIRSTVKARKRTKGAG